MMRGPDREVVGPVPDVPMRDVGPGPDWLDAAATTLAALEASGIGTWQAERRGSPKVKLPIAAVAPAMKAAVAPIAPVPAVTGWNDIADDEVLW
jgi:hypothetical protein